MRGAPGRKRWKAAWLLLLTALVPAFGTIAASAQTGAVEAGEAYRAQIEDWRLRRHQRLESEDGWLTLVGLEWLQEGENRLGRSDDADARIPGGPEDWGMIVLQGDQLRFIPNPAAAITIGGEPAKAIELVADSQGEPTVVRSGDTSFYIIYRQSYGLRIKDRRAPTLVSFSGVDQFEISESWRIEGDFEYAEPGTTIEIGNVLGQLNPSPVYGWFEFEREGESHRLLALGEETSESLWFLFADRTSGRETYGAGRFLYSDGMPEEGRLVVDFNKAYNPPCAFNDYSTCPLPPQQNRLKLAVTAGEKDFHHD
jgi:uncharacterized protein (DUF1684 family)